MVPQTPLPPLTHDTANNVDVVETVPPPTIDGVESVPCPNGEVVEDVVRETFGESLVELSLLNLYPIHIVGHIWNEEVALVEFILLTYVYFN